MLTPGIILSKASKPSIILVIIRCGITKARSPGTQSFKVGVKNCFSRRLSRVRRNFFKSPKVWIIGLESPKTLAILAMDSPYSRVFVTGSVKLTLLIKAKLELFDLIFFKA